MSDTNIDERLDKIRVEFAEFTVPLDTKAKSQIKQLIADEVAIEKAWQNALKIQIAELESELEPYRAFKAALQGEPNE